MIPKQPQTLMILTKRWHKLTIGEENEGYAIALARCAHQLETALKEADCWLDYNEETIEDAVGVTFVVRTSKLRREILGTREP